MKTTFLLFLLISAGIGTRTPLSAAQNPAEPLQIQRPDPDKILAELSPGLRLSSKQGTRIAEAITKKSREFEKLLREYDKVSAEEKRWREKSGELISGMREINRSIPDIIRTFLDDDQSQQYEAMLRARNRPSPEAGPEIKPDAAPGEERPAKKKRLVKRKKRHAGQEDEPGTTMVDDEPAGQPAPAARKKKKMLKKKKTAPPEAPPRPAGPQAGNPPGTEPQQGPGDAPGEDGGAPEEAAPDGEAGSYP